MDFFTPKDVAYLVLNFGEAQLKHELHKAKLEASTSSGLEDEWEFYWTEYQEAVTMALEIIQKHKPQPKPVKGHVDIEAVKQANDIVVVVEKYIKLRKSGKNYAGLCPFHADKKSPSLTIYPDNQSWYCFGCGKGGDVLDFIELVENTNFKGAVAVLGSA